MKRIFRLLLVFALAALLLTGCSFHTLDKLYCLPKRSEEVTNLQSQMAKVMTGLEYSAPLSGENQQTVQMADLDGDGEEEYLLFAKGNADKPLQIFIFSGNGETYELLDTIECSGAAFAQVEDIAMDESPGLKMVVGRQVSDQVVRSLSIYALVDGNMQQLMTTGYSRFLACDLDRNGLSELMVFRPDEEEGKNGIAELYSFRQGVLERSNEVPMSRPADKIKRIMSGNLNDGTKAVFAASDVDGNAILTDVYALLNGVLTNISLSNESGTSVQTLRNYYVYADDIDSDGVLELPSLISMKMQDSNVAAESQHIIRWYAMTSDGSEVDKLYTYHNYVGGWYMELSSEIAQRFTVTQLGNSYEFSLWDDEFQELEKLMTVYILTGQKREEQAVAENRFVLYRSESTVYAANLNVASAAYGMTKESVTRGLHLIHQDWNTGETSEVEI